MPKLAPHVLFAICEKPFCVWGWDLADRNRQFISDIDAEYFSYVSSGHIQDLQTETRQRAALAIRNNYHLALETFFSLMCATLQAPEFVPGWILRASTGDIRAFIKALDKEAISFPVKWTFDNHWGFDQVSALVHRYASWSQDESDATNERFARFWSWLAGDFLDNYQIKEYNSIKHGFRARPGGFFMRAGIESQPGTPAPPEAMRNMGGSHFGSSFYSSEPIVGDPKKSTEPHFYVRQNSLNWFPEETALKTELISLSMMNLKSFLSVEAGKRPSEVEFHRPSDPADFDKAWKTPGIISSNMDVIVEESDIRRATKEEILRSLRATTSAEQ